MTKIDQIGKITIKKREIIIKCGKENKKRCKTDKNSKSIKQRAYGKVKRYLS